MFFRFRPAYPIPSDGSLVLSKVTKTFSGRSPFTALRAVTLAIDDGEAVAIMGPSGSGKSTLLALMGGLDVPSAGAVVTGGVDLARLSEGQRSLVRRAHLAYVFQAYHLMPTLTAVQNAALPLHLLGINRREIAARARQALDDVGLAERAHHLPDALSGGECQRVAIARALVTRPRVLLADEPTGNLDSHAGQLVLSLIHDLRRRHHATLIVVTHDPAVAATCQRVIWIRDGQLDAAAQA